MADQKQEDKTPEATVVKMDGMYRIVEAGTKKLMTHPTGTPVDGGGNINQAPMLRAATRINEWYKAKKG